MQPKKLSPVLLVIALLALGCTSACQEAELRPTKAGNGFPEGPRSDVVLITLDTTRADYLSSYGYPEETSPHLDALALAGTRFEMAISSAAVTPVSHASILSGRFNHEHGLRVLSAASGFRLEGDVPTLATLLKSKGYQTAAIHSAFPVSRYFGFDFGFDVFDDIDAEMKKTGSGIGAHKWEVARYQRRSDETTDRALAYLERAESPFFLWIHYWDPHDIARLPPTADQVPPELLERTARNTDAQERNAAIRTLHYASEVRYMDAQIGRLLAALKQRSTSAETAIAVVSDHGEGLQDHGWRGHRILYQEQVRVPLILKLPGAPQGGVVADLVRSVDIMPTLLDYLGVDPPELISGRSLRMLIEGKPDANRVAFADQINGYDLNGGITRSRPLDRFLYMAIDSPYKLIYRPADPDESELYHLEADPDESENLYDSRPNQVRRLKQMLAEQNPWVTSRFEAPSTEGMTIEARQALEALGYLSSEDGEDEQDTIRWSWTCPDDPKHVARDRDARGDCATPLIPVRALP